MPKTSHKKKKKGMYDGISPTEARPTQHRVIEARKNRLKDTSIQVSGGTRQEDDTPVDALCSMPGEWESDSEETVVAEEPGVEEAGKIKVKPKAKRYEDSDCPLNTWGRENRDEYLDANMVTEGRGRFFLKYRRCAKCPSTEPRYRCRVCTGLHYLCRECILRVHSDEPLHPIQEWIKDCFVKTTLKTLGHRTQIGHPCGESCPFPRPSHKDFVVLAWNGIHHVTVNFCGCDAGKDIPRHIQLMEMGWWPSSYKEPRSAATFELLRNLHIINLRAQTPPTDFYKSLEHITDGTGLEKLPIRDEQLMMMLHQYRHIKMLKRCGRGHDPSGVFGTTHGSVTVPCRACPHPGKNLPPNWDQAATDDQFLYALFLAEDANFKQKARARPNDDRDPPLGPGWGVFVPNDVYMEELGKRTDQQEISHCVGFHALSAANTKRREGLRATGIGAVTCARHETFRPNGMGDLQAGERYSNMDFIAFWSLMGCLLTLVFFSYDIACQWKTYFFDRMKTYPEYMQLPQSMQIKFKVPKFHLVSHVTKCLAPFSFNYTEGAAKTDGEGVERTWAWLNTSSRSLSMMSLGGRWDTMDDLANFWNYEKMLTLDNSLQKKMVNGISESVVHTRCFTAFSDALKDDHSKELRLWQDQVTKWEHGKSSLCPYDVQEPKISLSKVKKDLADEEQEREEKGLNPSSAISISGVIMEGLEIEEAQRSLAIAAAEKHLTPYQQRSIQGRRTKLLSRIRKFRQCLLVHIPTLRRLIEAESSATAQHPEKMKLYLPSSLPETFRKVTCPPHSIDIEDRLRHAQAYDSLDQLRQQLRTRSIAYRNKSRLAPSQGMFTRTRTLQASIEKKIRVVKETYRSSRAALWALRGDGDWTLSLQLLEEDDIRGFGERSLKTKEKEDWKRAKEMAGVGENTIDDIVNGIATNVPTMSFNRVLALGQGKEGARLSWIWYTHKPNEGSESDGDSFEAIVESLRSEWCKARALSRRAREEIRLVEEEMRRSIEYCLYMEEWWKKQADRRADVPEALQEGLRAYAAENASTERKRSLRWTNTWFKTRERAKVILRHLSDPTADAALPALSQLEVELDMEDETVVGDDEDWVEE
ncbi:hypothetical protein V5O48_016083 [Marasmius crinis-equi]|uniref:CxC2-like cysteine cluster KDZ transposase-associated domain-containing protein n=1 Tax=Marasmius crinis-equi TaxID=585013 RepID=A0ABR3ESV0_9AGAR